MEINLAHMTGRLQILCKLKEYWRWLAGLCWGKKTNKFLHSFDVYLIAHEVKMETTVYVTSMTQGHVVAIY